MNRTSGTQQEPQSYQGQQEPPAPEGSSGCLVRVYWMLLGNVLLAAAAYHLVRAEGALTWGDLVYWLGAGGLIGARYVDIRWLQGQTAEGQPATMQHWRRYSLGVLGASAVLWITVRALRYLA